VHPVHKSRFSRSNGVMVVLVDHRGSCVISPRGTGYLLHSSSQFDWFSLAAMLPRPTCTLPVERGELRAASSGDVPEEPTVKIDDVTAAATEVYVVIVF